MQDLPIPRSFLEGLEKDTWKKVPKKHWIQDLAIHK